jgi:hypothetical protein
MDYVAVREDATTKAEAAVNVGLARLADVKYLRRNFRRGDELMRSLMIIMIIYENIIEHSNTSN